MPEISILGWVHTGIAIVALICGFYTLAKFKVINSSQTTGRIYLLCTLVTAATALMIFRHGGFGVAHALAVLTLLALVAGFVLEKTNLLGKLSPYVQAMAYTGTILFHMIPAITDGLMRLPADAPIVTSIDDPLLKGFYLAFLVTYGVGFVAQVLWLRKQG